MIPVQKGKKLQIELPIGKWVQLDSFDNARECRQAAAEHLRQAQTDTPDDKVRIFQAQSWKCIATDDPRLAHDPPMPRIPVTPPDE